MTIFFYTEEPQWRFWKAYTGAGTVEKYVRLFLETPAFHIKRTGLRPSGRPRRSGVSRPWLQPQPALAVGATRVNQRMENSSLPLPLFQINRSINLDKHECKWLASGQGHAHGPDPALGFEWPEDDTHPFPCFGLLEALVLDERGGGRDPGQRRVVCIQHAHGSLQGHLQIRIPRQMAQSQQDSDTYPSSSREDSVNPGKHLELQGVSFSSAKRKVKSRD